MDDFGTVLFVFFLSDPLGFEGGEGTECRCTSPDGVVSISWSNNLDHVGGWCHGVEFFLKSVWETLVKGSSSGKDDVLIEISSDIHIAVVNRGLSHFVYTECLVTFLDEVWEEESFWGHESWGVN